MLSVCHGRSLEPHKTYLFVYEFHFTAGLRCSKWCILSRYSVPHTCGESLGLCALMSVTSHASGVSLSPGLLHQSLQGAQCWLYGEMLWCCSEQQDGAQRQSSSTTGHSSQQVEAGSQTCLSFSHNITVWTLVFISQILHFGYSCSWQIPQINLLSWPDLRRDVSTVSLRCMCLSTALSSLVTLLSAGAL